MTDERNIDRPAEISKKLAVEFALQQEKAQANTQPHQKIPPDSARNPHTHRPGSSERDCTGVRGPSRDPHRRRNITARAVRIEGGSPQARHQQRTGDGPGRPGTESEPNVVSIALIDDHPAVRAGVEVMLAPAPDLQLVGSAAGEPEIWTLLSRHTPTVVVLDLHHPGRDGLALCLAIKHQPNAPAVVLYSATVTGDLAAAAAVAGADAIVGKADPAAVLIDAIRAAALPHPAGFLLGAGLLAGAAAALDPADHAILAMRLAGNRADEIADTLGAPLPVIEARIQTIVNQLMGRR